VATTAEGLRLRRKIDLVIPEVAGVSRTLVTHPRLADLYPEYLVTCHWVVRATVPLMETALGLARALQEDDPVAAQLAVYLERHCLEEAGEEEWLLADLELVGRDRAEVLARPPSPSVAALVGAQYYWALHFHPLALLGYLAALEGYPPTPELIDEMIAGSGYPREAFSTLAAHAELDPGHREELDRLLDTLDLTPSQSELLGLSAVHSVHTLAAAFGEVLEEA
jgi:hypothetical protein